MMDEYKDKRYIKEIIKEYNILLESWGSSESWDLNQFKTLENMISNERVKVLQESSDLTTENPELWELASEATLTPTDSATTLNHLKEVMLDDFPAPPETSYTVNYIDDCVADYLAPHRSTITHITLFILMKQRILPIFPILQRLHTKDFRDIFTRRS